jgi:hypothetical protein
MVRRSIRSAPGGTNHEAVTYTPQEEDTDGRSRQNEFQRLPTTAYPRKSDQNLSQGPIIHRPHRHRGARGISDFSHLHPVRIQC